MGERMTDEEFERNLLYLEREYQYGGKFVGRVRDIQSALAERTRERDEARGRIAQWDPMLMRKFSTACRERDEADRAFEQADDERTRLSDALIDAHRTLGGDGEWCAKPGQTCAAGDTGDLAIDVPALIEQLMERMARAKSDAAACAETIHCTMNWPDCDRHEICAAKRRTLAWAREERNDVHQGG